jgi:hypothetical protein
MEVHWRTSSGTVTWVFRNISQGGGLATSGVAHASATGHEDLGPRQYRRAQERPQRGVDHPQRVEHVQVGFDMAVDADGS